MTFQKGSSTSTQETGYPDWVESVQKDYMSRVGDYVKNNPDGMPVTGLNDTQKFARDIASGANTYLDGSKGILEGGAYTPQTVSAGDITGTASQFMNPFIDQVIGATTDRMRGERDAALGQSAAQAANSVAFGGSGSALRDAQINRGYNQDVGELTANLKSQGYRDAISAALGLNNLNTQDRQFGATQGLSTAVAGNNADAGAFDREMAKFGSVSQAGAIDYAQKQAENMRQLGLIDWLGSRIPGAGSTTSTTQPIYGNPLESILGILL
jgi:hypothetical protein